MKRLVHAFVLALKGLTGGLMIALWLCLLWQVFSRYVLKSPSTVTEELARILLMWLGTLGASLAFLLNQHIAFDWLMEKGSPRVRLFVRDFSLAMCTVFGLMCLIAGSTVVVKTWELGQVTPVLKLPWALVYVALPIAGFFICLSPFHEEG